MSPDVWAFLGFSVLFTLLYKLQSAADRAGYREFCRHERSWKDEDSQRTTGTGPQLNS
jgi:hypothetical protein